MKIIFSTLVFLSACTSQSHPLTFLKKIANDDKEILSGFSGLISLHDHYYAVRDNSQFLYQFDRDMNLTSKTKVLNLELPKRADLLKKEKPDFESLLVISENELLMIPSGSKDNRVTGALVRVSKKGVVEQISTVHFSELYEALKAKVGKVNIEGAVIKDNQMILFQRGNSDKSKNALVYIKFEQISSSNSQLTFKAQDLIDIKYPELPFEEGYPYTFTDALVSKKGNIIFLAVVERTNDAFDDGEILGMLKGEMDDQGNITKIDKITEKIKFEGISHSLKDSSDYLVISDSDDDMISSEVYLIK